MKPEQLSLLDLIDGAPLVPKPVRRKCVPSVVVAPLPIITVPDYLLRLPPGTSRVDDLIFQIKRDLAILRDESSYRSEDEFFLNRIASMRETVRRLLDEERTRA